MFHSRPLSSQLTTCEMTGNNSFALISLGIATSPIGNDLEPYNNAARMDNPHVVPMVWEVLQRAWEPIAQVLWWGWR
jgi:hypothetical protein